LDDKRFYRGIEALQLTDLRCIYGSQVADRIASVWLNQKVEVKGRVERDSKGRARLMRVTHLRLLDAQPEHTGQSEFAVSRDVEHRELARSDQCNCVPDRLSGAFRYVVRNSNVRRSPRWLTRKGR
jgi:hypothetical protein